MEEVMLWVGISIHALLAEGDIDTLMGIGEVILFLSTPSSRRATIAVLILNLYGVDFYPRPPRGGRPGSNCCYNEHGMISIHALLAEGDGRFLVTARGPFRISIHALLAEGDMKEGALVEVD